MRLPHARLYTSSHSLPITVRGGCVGGVPCKNERGVLTYQEVSGWFAVSLAKILELDLTGSRLRFLFSYLLLSQSAQ